MSSNRCKVCPLPGLACDSYKRPERGPRTLNGQCEACCHFEACHKKRGKYGAKRCELDGHSFASQAERDRYAELAQLEKAGLIRVLRLQPQYPLYAFRIAPSDIPFENGVRQVGTYIGDFSYQEKDGAGVWRLITEDVKGVRTAVFALKAKLFEACYGRQILETGRKSRRSPRAKAPR